MQTYSRLNKISNIKYNLTGFFRFNKIKILVLIFIAVLGIFTGIFTATKSGINITNFQGYNLYIYADGSVFSFDVFFYRMLSHITVLVIISICSYSIFLLPLSYILFFYRAYLIGLNCTFLIILFGFSGIFTSVIIIIPCQIIITFIFIIYFCLMINRAVEKKRFGICNKPKFINIFLITLLILTLLNFIETMLLILLNARTIFVI